MRPSVAIFTLTIFVSLGAIPVWARDVYTWAPNIVRDCYSTYVTEPQGSDCASLGNAKDRRWWLGTTNETANFSGGGLNDFLPGQHPMWKFSFHDRQPDGRLTFRNVVDKIKFNNFRDRYSFVGFTERFFARKPRADENLHIAFKMSLPAFDQDAESATGLAKNRVMVGMKIMFNGHPHFLEINLIRTDNFDLCTGDCDASGSIDRHYNTLSMRNGSEGIYYHGPAIGLPILVPRGPTVSYDIPVGTLIRSGWSESPQLWSNALLTGIYIGIEVWGKGRVWTELSDYRLYVP